MTWVRQSWSSKSYPDELVNGFVIKCSVTKHENKFLTLKKLVIVSSFFLATLHYRMGAVFLLWPPALTCEIKAEDLKASSADWAIALVGPEVPS